ncbi:hypothetical protein BZL41_00440 [Pseudomonas sp. PIC25]|uniref:DUF6531 domain-containing protein n=1 Tax=Pseudomonas sp. PIC25 TaxID=1958773 RepID=UPI000BAB9AD7|nr:DUF6531 domain-containing protein [Pseudomonas sp. PIC25]PAU66652.1 hypothetical protein BZL41_00440 [Pseudomonas sp. PIC25]
MSVGLRIGGLGRIGGREMVAVVTGGGLGLFNTSLNMLGGAGVSGQGGFGQAGGQALVNTGSGNLVLQFTDRQLSGLGLDLLHTRTYNTQGTYGDVEGDGWRQCGWQYSQRCHHLQTL